MSTLDALRKRQQERQERPNGPKEGDKLASKTSPYGERTETHFRRQDPSEPTAAVASLATAGRLPAAAPCPTCGCPLFWLDPYNRVRCAECSPPPSERVQRGDLHVVVLDDGSFGWLHQHRELTAAASPESTEGVRPSPPDVFELAMADLRPSLEQVGSGECAEAFELCQCGRGHVEINFFAEKFCRACKPSAKRRASRGGPLVPSSAPSVQLLARMAYYAAELSPETAEHRERMASLRKIEAESSEGQ